MKITKTQLKQIIREELSNMEEGGDMGHYKPPSHPEMGEMWTEDIWRGYQEGSPSAVGFDEPSEPDNPEYMYGWNHPNNIEGRKTRAYYHGRRPNQ